MELLHLSEYQTNGTKKQNTNSGIHLQKQALKKLITKQKKTPEQKIKKSRTETRTP